MNEQEFITQYIASFLATWTVNNYDDACMKGEHERLHKPPVEDATFLAYKAWEHYKLVTEV